MKNSFFLLIFIWTACSPAQKIATSTATYEKVREEIQFYQQYLTEQYTNPQTSPLKELATDFKGHSFFPIDLAYRVEAEFTKLENEPFFDIQTSGALTPSYRRYGLLTFDLNGEEYQLVLLQSKESLRNPLYRNRLFLAFTDLTNGETTYGGGRYIDLQMPKEDIIILDFNKSYNPYCAYATGYSCPIPPSENHLPIEIEAGIKFLSEAY